MYPMLRATALTLMTASLLLLCLPLQAGKLYRWVDKEGNVHYSDKIPPEASDSARTLLNERGVKMKSVDAARTPEEIAREQELARLRAEQQRLIDEQKAADRVLLRTFRSEDDIKMTLNGKLAAIDVQLQVIRSNIKRLKHKLANMQQDAASLELHGKPIPKNLLKDIENTRRTLKDGYAAIVRNEEQKEHYRKVYQKDLERFLKLKHLRPDKEVLPVTARRNLILDHLYPCRNEHSCDAAWEKAERFVEEYATTEIRMLSDTIIMTGPPLKDDDISITIARIRPVHKSEITELGDSTHLFLDLQCKPTPLGRELCSSPKVADLRNNFKQYVAGKTVSFAR